MKFDNILILTDLDGTFLNGYSLPPENNRKAIEYFKKNGGLFAAASGRIPLDLGSAPSFLPALTNIPSVLCNGAILYDFSKGEIIDEIFLDAEANIELIKKMYGHFPDVGIRVSTKDGVYLVHVNETMHAGYFRKGSYLLEHGLLHVCTPDELPKENWYRTSFDAEPEALEEARRFAEKDYSHLFSFMKAWRTVCEFQDIHATKGQGLKRLRDYLIKNRLATEELKVIAVGDNENDLDLLTSADLSACPSNAIDEVKKAAKWQLCDNNEGCIADLIERLDRIV